MNIIKKISKQAIVVILSFPVKILLFRKKPEVIAITGSAGKTSCKEFIGILLNSKYNTLVSSDGYNTEIGAPLALFGEKVPENIKSLFAWLKLIAKLYYKSLSIKNFSEKVVIEMGADNRGDIKYLASLFRPNIGIVLEVLPVHMAQFKNIEAIAKEKVELVKAIPAYGRVYLNHDNLLVRDMANFSQAPVTFFGSQGNFSGFYAKNLKSDISGLSFTLNQDGSDYSLRSKIYGRHMIYPLLAAIAVAKDESISMSLIIKLIKNITPFPGRMNIIEGVNGSIIIDDSYNANPKSVMAALDFLSEQKGRRIALIGSMNELGSFEKEAHKQVAQKAIVSADMIFTVGSVAEKYLITDIKKSSFKGQYKAFKTSTAAGIYLSKILKKGDIVLAKGSQNNVRVELAIVEIMAHPEKKSELLVRQSKFWKNI